MIDEIETNLLCSKTKIVKNYSELFYDDIPIIPIPFFGNIKTAKIITIGANPSSKELVDNQWHEDMSVLQITNKLISYFNNNPHKWFDVWEVALNKSGFSYKDGTAAHIDLCPWATKSLSSLDSLGLTDKTIQLFSESVPAFIETLTECSESSFVLMAGTVTKRYWLNDFIYKFANLEYFSLNPRPKIERGGPFINKHVINIANRKLKVLFSSSSPSATGEKKKILPDLIYKSKDFILQNI